MIFFCPSFAGDRFHYIGSTDNDWPPSLQTTRCTYSCRGSTNNVNPQPNTWATDAVVWGTGSQKEPFYPLKVTNGATSSATWAIRAPMFRLNKLKSKAIVSDVMSSDTRTKPAHKKGINVLYANGAAKWVDYKLFQPQIESSQGMFNPGGDYISDRIWNNFDVEQQLYPGNL